MTPKKAKNSKPVDLSEYAEEAIPFDAVIRKLAKAKAVPIPPMKKQKKREK